MKQSKITKSARGEQCTVRIVGVCNFRPETTVFSHLNGGGMGRKKPDIHGCYCCSDCHDALDGRRKTAFTRNELKLMHYEAMERTQLILLEKGLIVECK